MAGTGIDLKALVIEASRAGVELTMYIGSPMEGIVLSGRRGLCRDYVSFPVSTLAASRIVQGQMFMRALEEMIYRLNELEQRMIETGGTDQ